MRQTLSSHKAGQVAHAVSTVQDRIGQGKGGSSSQIRSRPTTVHEKNRGQCQLSFGSPAPWRTFTKFKRCDMQQVVYLMAGFVMCLSLSVKDDGNSTKTPEEVLSQLVGDWVAIDPVDGAMEHVTCRRALSGHLVLESQVKTSVLHWDPARKHLVHVLVGEGLPTVDYLKFDPQKSAFVLEKGSVLAELRFEDKDTAILREEDASGTVEFEDTVLRLERKSCK